MLFFCFFLFRWCCLPQRSTPPHRERPVSLGRRARRVVATKVQASPHKSTNPKGKGRTAGLRKGTKKGLKKQNPVRKGRTKATARTRQSASFRSGEEDRA